MTVEKKKTTEAVFPETTAPLCIMHLRSPDADALTHMRHTQNRGHPRQTRLKTLDMNMFIKNNWARINLAFHAFVFACLLTKAYALSIMASSHPWFTADWLINYQAGFVRRGLLGEILLRISSAASIGLITLTTFVQASAYACILFFSYKLSKTTKPTVWNALIIFSPAFILFPVITPAGGFRKEILMFTLLSFHSFYLSRIKQPPSNNYLVFLAWSFVFLALSHEAVVAFLPYFICGLYLKNRQLDWTHLFKYSLVLAPAIATSALLMLCFKGNADTVAGICSSLGKIAPQDCQTSIPHINGIVNNGAISALAIDYEPGRHVVAMINTPRARLVYAILFLLAITPVLYRLRKLAAPESAFPFLLFPLLAFMASLPLLLVFVDYGRLIYFHATCLTLVVLQLLNSDENTEPLHDDPASHVWILCLLFILTWRVPLLGGVPRAAFVPIKIYRHMQHASIPPSGQAIHGQADPDPDLAQRLAC